MGKGRIITAHGEGRYTLEILEDRSRAEAAKTAAMQRVAALDDRITGLESDLAGAQDAVDAAATAQDQAIADYQAALTDDQVDEAEARQKMLAAGEAITRAAAQRDAIRSSIRAFKTERLALQTRIDRIDALPPLRQIDAWCADYVEDLSGEVATAEVPGEVGQVIIQPGFADGAAWNPSEDGAIQPALSGTPASVFYNLAMMPGWQRWRPTFRIATISNIDNDLCDITLDAATSSQQGLSVNAQGSYSGVPIMYMDCNGDAFEDGDRVLVAFSGNTDAPMVVGFEREPKSCTLEISAFTSSDLKNHVTQHVPGAFSTQHETKGVWMDGPNGSYTCEDVKYNLYNASVVSVIEQVGSANVMHLGTPTNGIQSSSYYGNDVIIGDVAISSINYSFEGGVAPTVSVSASGYIGSKGYSIDQICSPGLSVNRSTSVSGSATSTTEIVVDVAGKTINLLLQEDGSGSSSKTYDPVYPYVIPWFGTRYKASTEDISSTGFGNSSRSGACNGIPLPVTSDSGGSVGVVIGFSLIVVKDRTDVYAYIRADEWSGSNRSIFKVDEEGVTSSVSTPPARHYDYPILENFINSM